MGANKLDNTTDYTTTGNKTNNVFTNQVNKVIVWVRNALNIPSSSQQRWVPLSTVKVSDGDEGDEDEECVEDSGASPDRGRPKVKPHYITIGLVLFSMLLLFIASTFYIKSLQGGDVDWLHKNIRIIAKFLIISIVLYYIGFFIFFSCYRRFKKVIWFPLLLVIGIVLWFAVWGKDIDYTLEKHGLYNVMILGAVEFMLILYTLWWLLSIRILGLRKAIIFQLVLLNLIFLISIIRNVYFKAEWKKGVFGRELQNNGRGCDIPTNYVPYEAYLPEGYTNILGQKCPASRHFATLGSDNILTINCDPGQARYIEYPDYLEGTDYRINFALPPSVYWNYSAPVVTYAETVQAECGEDRQLFVRNIVKPSLLEEAKLETNNATKNNDTIEQLNHPPNIMFLFIDALSRAHTHRRMYRTLDAFTDLVNSGVMDMYEFFKYHAFASHTGPNTVPMFTGAQIYSEYSPTLDYPFYNSTDGFSYVDHELWWNKFDSKFVKSWVYGSCENWMDGYIHNNTAPFGLDHISVMPFCNSQCYPLPNPFGPMQGPFGAKARCVNDKHVHEYMLEYTEDYFSNYKDVAKIVQLSFLEAHEGTLEVITQLDRDFPAFFKSEAVHSELNNTFIILTADHGNHMSPFYVWTPNGKLENKLPALFILTPKWFSKRYPELANNLSNNQQRLVTPLDVYNTLMQLHDLPEFKQNSKSEIKNVSAMKGIFGEISEDRGCYEAFISPEECVCKN